MTNPERDPSKPSPDARQWLSTSLVFRQLAEAIHLGDWVPTVPKPEDAYPDENERHAARQSILATYSAPVLRECVEGLAGWFANRELPQLSHPARYWLHRQAVYISDFCAAHVCQLKDNPHTIFPYPSDRSQFEVCEWLMGDWWAEIGLKQFVQQATTDQSLFYASNT